MKLIVTIDLDNAAFADDVPGEVKEVLSRLPLRLEMGNRCDVLRDSNGNTCGSWEVGEYVELSPDDVESVKSALAWRGHSSARSAICGRQFDDESNGQRGRYDDRKVRVLAEVRS